MKVTFAHTDEAVVRWRPGEIISLQVVTVSDQGYECETVETFDPDLKAQHAKQVKELALEATNRLIALEEERAALIRTHDQELSQHRATIEKLTEVCK